LLRLRAMGREECDSLRGGGARCEIGPPI